MGKLLRDGKRLLAGYGDGGVSIWSLKEETASTVLASADSGCTTADVHHTVDWAVVGTDNGCCLMINTKSNSLMSKLVLTPGNEVMV